MLRYQGEFTDTELPTPNTHRDSGTGSIFT